MSAYETEYFRLRSIAERQRAEAASIPDIAAIHERLAREYDALVELARAEALLPVRTLHGGSDRQPEAA